MLEISLEISTGRIAHHSRFVAICVVPTQTLVKCSLKAAFVFEIVQVPFCMTSQKKRPW